MDNQPERTMNTITENRYKLAIYNMPYDTNNRMNYKAWKTIGLLKLLAEEQETRAITAEKKLKEMHVIEQQRDRLEIIAGQLIAMIRMNVIGRTFEECTIKQIDKHLKPWIDEIAAVKGGTQ